LAPPPTRRRTSEQGTTDDAEAPLTTLPSTPMSHKQASTLVVAPASEHCCLTRHPCDRRHGNDNDDNNKDGDNDGNNNDNKKMKKTTTKMTKQ